MRDRILAHLLAHLLGDLADLIAEHPVAAATVCRKLSQAIFRESSEQEDREREERERSRAHGHTHC